MQYRALPWLLAGLLLVLVVGQAPHLVHHLFEQGSVQADCVLASAGERAAAVSDDAPVLTVPGDAARTDTGRDLAVLPQALLGAPESRAPPLTRV